ncbi:MAG: hypothetical protein ABSB15_12280 [Bryobacteraceae bacterium]
MRSFATLAGLVFTASLLQAQAPKTPADFRVSNPIVSQFEDGPPLAGGQKLVAGETLFFRFGVVNFKTSATGNVQVTGHAQAFDPRGTAIVAEDEVAIGTTLSQEDKDWKPVLHSQFQVPSIAPPGIYRIKFEATDEQTHQSAAGETTFAVEGRDVRPSPTLTIRELGFFRGQDDDAPLKVAAYRAGDMVWVRFDVTGYKYGEQNAIDVAYDVAVANSEGKELFAQQDAAVEKSQAFYPQPWVPGIFSLTLQPDMSKGAYAVVITARDGFGNQTVTQKAQFRVE